MRKKTIVLGLSLALSLSLPVVSRSGAVVDPAVAAYLTTLRGRPSVSQFTVEEARSALVHAQAAAPVHLAPCDISTQTLSVKGRDITLTIVRPEHTTGNLPAFMFFHGGGWVVGDFRTHERLVRDLVTASGAVAVFVDYSRSPEVAFGVANEEAYAATVWTAAHGKDMGIDGSRLAVAGNSAGGTMATVVAMMARERHGPHLRFEVLMWPITDARMDSPSYNDFASGFYLSREAMGWFWGHYAPTVAERNDPYASPLKASPAQLAGLPPTLVETAEFDVLRDEGEAYASKLAAAGVPVTSVRYRGVIHNFAFLNALATLPATHAAIEQAGSLLRTHLFDRPELGGNFLPGDAHDPSPHFTAGQDSNR